MSVLWSYDSDADRLANDPRRIEPHVRCHYCEAAAIVLAADGTPCCETHHELLER